MFFLTDMENEPFRIVIELTNAYNGWTEGRFIITEKDFSCICCIMNFAIANGDIVRAIWLLNSRQ